MRNRVPKKLVLVLSLCALVLVGGLAVLRYAQMKTISDLYGRLEKDFDSAADASPMRTFVTDYSYWDDLVRFVKGGREPWARYTFKPALKEFKLDAVWVYRADGSCAYALNAVTPNSLQELPVPREVSPKLFARNRFCRFFVTTPQGVMEIRGATIHPTADPNRLSQPQGYLFAGKLWSLRYMDELSAKSGGTLTLSRSAARRAPVDPATIIFSRPLPGWDGKAVMFVRVRVPAPLVSAVVSSINRQFATAVAVAGILLILVYFLLDRWVRRPLGLIEEALSIDDGSLSLPSLAGSSVGYHSLANQVRQLVEQRAQLLAEAKDLRQLLEVRKKEGESLLTQIKGFTDEIASLKDAYACEQDIRRKNAETFGSGNYDLLQMAYDDLNQRFQETRTKLHVVSELLQREIIKSHEHHKAEMVAAHQREQALKDLSRLTQEMEQQKTDVPRTEIAASIISVPVSPASGFIAQVTEETEDTCEKKPKNKRKALGSNLPKINFTEAQC